MADSQRLEQLIEQERATVRKPPTIDSESIPVWHEDGQDWTFHEGQVAAWESTDRFVLIVAGARSGKSRCGAHLLLREIQRTAKPGEINTYLIVGPDVQILQRGPLITLKEITKCDIPGGDCTYSTTQMCFNFTPDGCERWFGFRGQVKVFVGYAHKPESLQAATYRAVWADEAGQDTFVRESWEAINMRTSIHRGRIFVTTTPYTIDGWLMELITAYNNGETKDTFHIRFKSTANPRFSQEEYDRILKTMPPWRAKMYLDGEFSIPEGAIYDCFSDENVIDDADFLAGRDFIPDHWPRHLWMDFGQVNTCAVFAAEAQEDRLMGGTLVRKGDLVGFADYLTGGRTAVEHAAAVSRKGLGLFRSPDSDREQTFEHQVGGTWSEDEWRNDYIAAGLAIARPPVKELEVGIDRVYHHVSTRTLRFFKESCKRTIADMKGYRRELDKRGEVSEKIFRKETHHPCDCVRYGCLFCRPMAAYEPPERDSVPAKKEDRELYARNRAILEQEEKELTA